MICQRLWLMALDDDRGLPRVAVAPHVVATGLLLDLEAAGLINWRDDDQLFLVESAQTDDALLRWAVEQLDILKTGAASRFAMNAIVLKTWDWVGQSLTDAGLVTCRASRWRRNRYHLVAANARNDVVTAARDLLFSDTQQAADDPCLAVLSACSVGEELLFLSSLTDFEVAQRFGARDGDSPVEQRVWQCVKFTSTQAIGRSVIPPVAPGS